MSRLTLTMEIYALSLHMHLKQLRQGQTNANCRWIQICSHSRWIHWRRIHCSSDWLFLDYELFEAITVLALIESINVGSESLFVDPELLVLYPNLYSLDPNLLSLDQEGGRQTLIQQ